MLFFLKKYYDVFFCSLESEGQSVKRCQRMWQRLNFCTMHWKVTHSARTRKSYEVTRTSYIWTWRARDKKMFWILPLIFTCNLTLFSFIFCWSVCVCGQIEPSVTLRLRRCGWFSHYFRCLPFLVVSFSRMFYLSKCIACRWLAESHLALARFLCLHAERNIIELTKSNEVQRIISLLLVLSFNESKFIWLLDPTVQLKQEKKKQRQQHLQLSLIWQTNRVAFISKSLNKKKHFSLFLLLALFLSVQIHWVARLM